MEEVVKINTPTYNLPGVVTVSPLDMLEKILAVYSTYYIISGKGQKPNLRPQLLKVLAIYVLHGYSKESKALASKSSGLKGLTRIDGINKELRDAGYLIKDAGNDHKAHLNEDLTALSLNFPKLMEAVPELSKKGVNSMKMNIGLELKFPI